MSKKRKQAESSAPPLVTLPSQIQTIEELVQLIQKNQLIAKPKEAKECIGLFRILGDWIYDGDELRCGDWEGKVNSAVVPHGAEIGLELAANLSIKWYAYGLEREARFLPKVIPYQGWAAEQTKFARLGWLAGFPLEWLLMFAATRKMACDLADTMKRLATDFNALVRQKPPPRRGFTPFLE